MRSPVTLTMNQKDPYHRGQQLLVHVDGASFFVFVLDPFFDGTEPDGWPTYWTCMPAESDETPVQILADSIVGVVTPAPDLEGFDRALRKMKDQAKCALAEHPGANMKTTEGMVMAYSISLILLSAVRSGTLEGGEA